MNNEVVFAREVLTKEACRLLARELTIIAWEMKHEVGPFQEALFLFASMTERTFHRVSGVLASLQILLEPADLGGGETISEVQGILNDLVEMVIKPLKHARSTSDEETDAIKTLVAVGDNLWCLRDRADRLTTLPQSITDAKAHE